MKPKIAFAGLGALSSVALAAGLIGPGIAQSDDKDEDVVRAGDAVVGNGEVRAGNAVVDKDGVRIEGGPSVGGEESGSNEEGSATEESVTEDEESSVEEESSGDEESIPVGENEVVMRLKGDEGVEFSGTCSSGGEEKEIEGRVPEEFTFNLDGDELECEIRTEGDGTMKMILVSSNDRVVQSVSGNSTIKFTYSKDGISSSTSSGSGSSNNVVSQSSSSSVIQSNSSSTSN